MNDPSIEELLLRWHDGSLTPEELLALQIWLAKPEGRAKLLEDALLNEAILEALKAETLFTSAADVLSQIPNHAQMNAAPLEAAAASRRPQVKRFTHWIQLFSKWKTAAAMAACLVLAAGFYAAFSTGSIGASFLRSSAEVVVQRGARVIAAQDVSSLRGRDIVKTTWGATAVIKYHKETTRVELGENTELIVENTKNGKRLELVRGQIEAEVAPQRAGQPMILVTPQTEAKVVGTRFSLASQTAATWLKVQEGAVVLTRRADARSITVEQGESVVSTADYYRVRTDDGPGNAVDSSSASAGSPPGDAVIYGFDDIKGEGQGVSVEGVHGGIDFGQKQWLIEASWGGLIRCAWFSEKVPSRTFKLPPGKFLKSIRVGVHKYPAGGKGGAYSVSDGVNPPKTGNIIDNIPITVITGWTTGGRDITVGFSTHNQQDGVSSQQDGVIDDITY
ncbi:MAG: FecR family protein [Verrucomicrobiales bacterium]|nr:FecR family protein [Verrucomicrobiales bacterium]